MSLDNKIHIIIIIICDNTTQVRQIKFVQGKVVSSEYKSMNRYVMYLDRNLKTMQEYLHNAHGKKLKSMYHYNKKSCDTVHNSQLTKILFHCVK
jgi:hypothetical protein